MDKKQRIFFIRLCQRITLFLFLYLLVLVFFYALGNMQSFMDSSQLLVLKLVSYTSIVLLIVSAITFFLSAILSFAQKTVIYIGTMLFNLVSCAAALVALLFSAGINLLALGTLGALGAN